MSPLKSKLPHLVTGLSHDVTKFDSSREVAFVGNVFVDKNKNFWVWMFYVNTMSENGNKNKMKQNDVLYR